MKRIIKIIVLSIFLVNCYGSDGDPGSTTYCRTIDGSSVFFDKKCQPRNELLNQFLYSPPVVRCLFPNRVINQTTNMCYAESSQRIFYEIKETVDGLTYSILGNNQISASDGKSIAVLDGAQVQVKSESINTGKLRAGQGFKKIYEFDPVSRSLGKILWNQDPNDPANAKIKESRVLSQKDLLVPMQTSKISGIKWIVGVSSTVQNVLPDFQGHFYQIMEVGE
jgi:hypothetical protein